jgi:hypothetical protein
MMVFQLADSMGRFLGRGVVDGAMDWLYASPADITANSDSSLLVAKPDVPIRYAGQGL